MSKLEPGYTSTPEEEEFELRAHIGSVWSGGRLFIGMYTFLLASLAYTYFYLRSSNSGGLWRPHHMTAPMSFGWGIVLCTVVAAFLVVYGQARLRRGASSDWQVAGWTALLLLLGALTLQIWELTKLPFYPGASGYSSSFIGWGVFDIATLVVAAYWVETALARALRLSKELGGDRPLFSTDPAAQSWRANVASMSYFLGFVGVGAAFFFALFYLI